jgi:hypothetical protein
MIKRNFQKGIVLPLSLFLLALFSAVGLAFLVYSVQEAGFAVKDCYLTQALWTAEAGLEVVKKWIKESEYIEGNVWLANHSSREGTVVVNGLEFGNGKAYVTVYSPTQEDERYTIISRGVLTKGKLKGTYEEIELKVIERDTFAKHLWYTGNDKLYVGTTTVHGDVHVNKYIGFFFGGARMFGATNAVTGIYYWWGASEDNTSFYGPVNPYAPYLPPPQARDIAELEEKADEDYRVSGNAVIEFRGDRVIINGVNLPLPANKLIFVKGRVYVKGNLNGRVTIASQSNIYITDNLRYVDGEGDPAYYYPGEVGGEYVANPKYNGKSLLGLMTTNNVVIPNEAPYNIEFHCAILSTDGRWYCSLGRRKGHMRFVGSMITKYRGWRYSSWGYGYAESGEYIYDPNLRYLNPAYFAKINKPRFVAWRKLKRGKIVEE